MRNEASCLPRCPRQVPPTEPRRAGASQISVSVLLPQALRRLKGRFRDQGDRFFALPRRSAVGQIERLPPPGPSARYVIRQGTWPEPTAKGATRRFQTFLSSPANWRVRPSKDLHHRANGSSHRRESGHPRQTAGHTDGRLTSTRQAVPSLLSGRRCRSPR